MTGQEVTFEKQGVGKVRGRADIKKLFYDGKGTFNTFINSSPLISCPLLRLTCSDNIWECDQYKTNKIKGKLVLLSSD